MNSSAFTPDGRPIVKNSADLQHAIAAGHDPTTFVIQPEGSEDKTAAIAAAVGAAVAAERAAFEGERIAWAGERARLVDQAMNLNLPEQEDGIRLQERSRISEIRRLTQRGFENVAQQSIDSGEAVASFALRQLQAIQDRGITLDAIRRDAPPPAPHAAPPSPDAKPDVGASWDRAINKLTGARK